MALTPEAKKQLIANLIQGVGGESPWTAEDVPALNAIPEAKLEALERQRVLAVNALAKAAAAEEEMDDEEDEEDEEEMPAKKPEVPVKNKCGDKPKTLNEFMLMAPPEVRSVVANAIKFEKAQKTKLVKTITANERNVFTPDYLNGLSLDELQGIAALATNEKTITANGQKPDVLQPHYGGIPGVTRSLTANFAQEDLDMAVFNSDAEETTTTTDNDE